MQLLTGNVSFCRMAINFSIDLPLLPNPEIIKAIQDAYAALYDADTADLEDELEPHEVLVITPTGEYFVDVR